MTTGKAIASGAIAVGVLDIADAMLFFYIRHGVSPVRICQSIAAGVLGRDTAVAGGLKTAALGLFLHFVIATLVVAVIVLAAKNIRAIAAAVRRPLIAGPVYGIVVFLMMYTVILPMSRVTGGIPPWGPVLWNGVLIHIFGVGLPAVLAARAATR
jgi:hypothetical protein